MNGNSNTVQVGGRSYTVVEHVGADENARLYPNLAALQGDRETWVLQGKKGACKVLERVGAKYTMFSMARSSAKLETVQPVFGA